MPRAILACAIHLCFIMVTLVCLQAVPGAAAAEGSFQRTLQVTGAVNLEVTTGSGSVQVRTGSSNQVQVSGHIKATEWFGGNAEDKVKRLQANPPIQQSGNDIRIGHIDDPELRHNISISYELMVPVETQLRVTAARATRAWRALADRSTLGLAPEGSRFPISATACTPTPGQATSRLIA